MEWLAVATGLGEETEEASYVSEQDRRRLERHARLRLRTRERTRGEVAREEMRRAALAASAGAKARDETNSPTRDARAIELYRAIDEKQLSMLCRIVNRGLDVNTTLTSDGESAVHAVIRLCGTRRDAGYVSVLRCLLRLGADADRRSSDGSTPAHSAASFDLTAMLSLLSEFGANFDLENDEGNAPVHVCAALGKTSAAEWLLTVGHVHVEREHHSGTSLAMFAATAGHLETLKCLRRLGADLRRPCRIEHDLIQGQRVRASIMGMACYEGRDDVVKWLVEDCGIAKSESEIVVVTGGKDEDEDDVWHDTQDAPTTHDDDFAPRIAEAT